MVGGRVPEPRGQLDAQRAHNMSHSALYTVTRAPAMRLPVISIHQKKSRERYLSLSAIATVGARVWRQIKKKRGKGFINRAEFYQYWSKPGSSLVPVFTLSSVCADFTPLPFVHVFTLIIEQSSRKREREKGKDRALDLNES